MSTFIGSAEAARILGIDRSVLLKRVKAGALEPAEKLPAATGAYLFNRAEIIDLANGENS